MKLLLYFLVCIPSMNCLGQQRNYVSLLPGETTTSIIRKAANVIPHPRQLRWQRLELTAFFHFGINTFTNREWGTGKEDPKIFNPSALDANQWVSVAKQAGIKQVILTAKHHDGFCLWPTATTQHSLKNSPFQNGDGDVVRAVAEACKKNKIGFGIYLSPWDMNAPIYGTEAYNDFFVQQLTELLTNYGRVDEVWFDGANGEGPNGKKQRYDFDRWYKVIRQLQPSATIAIMGPDVRWVGTESGYGRETEWSVVPTNNLNPAAIAAASQQAIVFKPTGDMMGNDLGSREKILNATGLVWYPAETDVSIRPGWFYHPAENDKVKTPAKLLDIYYHSVGKNSVLLLNIPPDTRGLLHEADVSSLSGWKKLRDKIFKTNLARGSKIQSSNGKAMNRLLDGDDGTHFTTDGRDSTTTIEFTLKGSKIFDVLMLQENIRMGQRVEKFVFEYFSDGEWKKVTEGTTIGYKRLLRFPAITASQLRLRIESCRLNPFISEFGLYKEPLNK